MCSIFCVFLLFFLFQVKHLVCWFEHVRAFQRNAFWAVTVKNIPFMAHGFELIFSKKKILFAFVFKPFENFRSETVVKTFNCCNKKIWWSRMWEIFPLELINYEPKLNNNHFSENYGFWWMMMIFHLYVSVSNFEIKIFPFFSLFLSKTWNGLFQLPVW